MIVLAISLCLFMSYEAAEVQFINPVVDGSYTYGYVAVKQNGSWGTICDDGFDNNDAQVVCRMLGFKHGVFHKYYQTGDGMVDGQNRTALRILLDEMSCSGNELSIASCSHAGLGNHDCEHSKDIGVKCFNETDYTATAKFINPVVDGNYTLGYVAIHSRGEWGTICDDNFGNNDAQVVCRMLGFEHGEYHSYHRVGDGLVDGRLPRADVRTLFDDVACNGNEASIDQCTYTKWEGEDCGHNEDVGVKCFNTTDYTVRVKFINPVVDGNTSFGYVAVNYQGEWGTVCYDGFDKNDAEVLCSMLGFKHGYTIYTDTAYRKGKGDGTILGKSRDNLLVWLRRMNCNGNETHIDQCTHMGWRDQSCSHTGDMAIKCSNADIQVKAQFINPVEENNSTYGYIAIFREGEWGTICDDNFDHREARVLCNMVGFKYGLSGRQYRIGNGTIGGMRRTERLIWVDELRCRGNETSIQHCNHNSWEYANCNHNEDAAIKCSNDPADDVTTAFTPNWMKENVTISLNVTNVKYNNIIHTFSYMPKTYTVSLEVKATKYIRGQWRSILHFAVARSLYLPALYLNGDTLDISDSVDNKYYNYVDIVNFPLNKWVSIVVSHTMVGSKYWYTAHVDGKEVKREENRYPRSYTNVDVYASNWYSNPFPGQIRNLKVTFLIPDFDATIDVYTSPSFDTKDKSLEVKSHQPMNVGIDVTHENDNYKFVVNRCFATSNTHNTTYTFFDKKCPLDPSFKIVNRSKEHFYFQIDPFTFQLRQSFFLHCDLIYCAASATSEECTQHCDVRPHHSVDQTNKRDKLGETSVNSGNMHFDNHQTCKDKSCPVHSHCLDLPAAECRCDEGYVYNFNDNTCTNDRVLHVTDVHIEGKFLRSYSNKSSVEFLQFAIQRERGLIATLRQMSAKVNGVKVTCAREGSDHVVLDMLLTYANTVSSPMEATHTFIASLTSGVAGMKLSKGNSFCIM